MAYVKKKKPIKSVMVYVKGDLYEEYKELTKSLKLNRDKLNTEILEAGMRDFIKAYRENADAINQEIEAAEKTLQKRILKIQNKHGLNVQKLS